MRTPTNKTIPRLLTWATALSAALSPGNARAGFATPGQGLGNVLAGSVDNGALFVGTVPTWINATPPVPYSVQVSFALPACDRVVASRLIMTAWGGTANYTCQMSASVNSAPLPGANPLLFGSTSDANAVFNPDAPCAYGAGSGLWLVALPVPAELLHKDGSGNTVNLVLDTAENFDGRLHFVTLVAVYQSPALTNQFDYALAEGSGDLYGTPTAPQVNQRTVTLGTVNPAHATAATLTALYTYGDTGQNDRLFFNGAPLGGNDLAQWDKAGTGLNYGPSVVSFDVLGSLLATNTVKFTVAATDVSGTRETSLRPQLAVLGVTRPPVPPALTIAPNLVLSWPASAGTFQLEARPTVDSGPWTAVTNVPVVSDGQNHVVLSPGSPQRFYQLRKTN